MTVYTFNVSLHMQTVFYIEEIVFYVFDKLQLKILWIYSLTIVYSNGLKNNFSRGNYKLLRFISLRYSEKLWISKNNNKKYEHRVNNFITYLIFNVLLVIEQFHVGNLMNNIIIEEISKIYFQLRLVLFLKLVTTTKKYAQDTLSNKIIISPFIILINSWKRIFCKHFLFTQEATCRGHFRANINLINGNKISLLMTEGGTVKLA